ncbi:PHD-zinc-finger like domain-containing protein [Gigaspora rosea]|uniref:PHD-zinc-finger like domain-containing protein n=1 Tax=Gigaspora rosea TaxID=44941 RepID=A0A397V2Z2_9GLOM|nr:PHD-zinc-finger like domain-containing protein [Gigaspora rosea]
MIASISSKFSENTSTEVSDSSVKIQQNRQSPKQSRTHPDTSSDSGSQQGVRRSRRTSLREKPTNYAEGTGSSSSESEVKLGVRRRRLSSREDSVSSSNSDLESRPVIKRARSSRGSQSPKKSSSSSLSEISENYLSSALDSESETQEPPSPPETPSLPLQKRRSSQSESSDDTSEDTDRTSEPPSPPGTPIPFDPCKICGGFEPLDSQYPLLVCAGCQICVHTDCYGISNRKPMGRSWRCDPCLNGRVRRAIKVKKCVLCSRPEGVNNAMKRTNGNNWVHVLCATFTPETSFYDAENVFLVMDIEDIKDESWDAICSICQIRGGACIQCSNYTCKKFLHITCAQEAGCNIGFELKSPKLASSQQESSPKSSPSKHKSEETQIDMEQPTFDEISQSEMVSRVFCQDHSDLPENFVKLNIRDSHSHESALYIYIKKYKQYDASLREYKLKTRYTLTIPDHVRAAMNAYEAWYEQNTSDDEMDIDEDNVVDTMTKVEDLKIQNYIIRPSNRQCSRCPVTRTIKWWPAKWPYLPRSAIFSVRDVSVVICHSCFQKEKAATQPNL